MKTTKKSMQFGSMLVYCTVYDMCVCGGPTSIFFQGAPNPLATALGMSMKSKVCICIL